MKEIKDIKVENAALPAESAGKGRRRRSVIKGQRNAIIILICVILVLAIALPLVLKYIVNVITFEDYDGTKYKIKAVGGVYALYDTDGNKMEQTVDGYYVTSKLSTLLEIDATTGDYTIVAVVDTEEGESLGTSQRYLMFNHISQDNTQSVEVHNSYGTFTIYRDADNDFQIKGFDGTPWKQTLVSSLIVNCGYTLTTLKVTDPIKDDAGNYTEYGLAKETRKDADGNDYEYSPAWYRITDINGSSYTVIVGDETPAGTGYYVKYTNRDAVYVMDYAVDASMITMYDTDQNADSIANILAEPVETFVSPVVCYPMTVSTYFDVTNFMVFTGDSVDKILDEKNEETVNPFICFSFWDMDERFGTFYHSRAYELQYPDGYLANTDATDAALQNFYATSFKGVTKLGPTDEDYEKYGLLDPEYIIYFIFNNIEHYIPVSAKTADGTYYMASAVYNMIVEVNEGSLLFLDYKLIDWVAPEYFDMYLAWAEEITVEADGHTYTFNFDNSKSDSMSNPTYSENAKANTQISSDKMTMTGHDEKGNSIAAFSSYSITDESGFTWTITAEKVSAVDKDGNKSQISGAHYATNALGNEEVIVVDGKIHGTNGETVESITANQVVITDANGHTTTYLRYGMTTFRKFYQSLLYASIEGDVHDGYYGLTDDKIAEKLSKPDENADVIIRIKTTYEKEPEYVYRYYHFSERHSMITVNGGNGEFYVLRSFTDKIVTDAARVINGESVDPISKY